MFCSDWTVEGAEDSPFHNSPSFCLGLTTFPGCCLSSEQENWVSEREGGLQEGRCGLQLSWKSAGMQVASKQPYFCLIFLCTPKLLSDCQMSYYWISYFSALCDQRKSVKDSTDKLFCYCYIYKTKLFRYCYVYKTKLTRKPRHFFSISFCIDARWQIITMKQGCYREANTIVLQPNFIVCVCVWGWGEQKTSPARMQTPKTRRFILREKNPNH